MEKAKKQKHIEKCIIWNLPQDEDSSCIDKPVPDTYAANTIPAGRQRFTPELFAGKSMKWEKKKTKRQRRRKTFTPAFVFQPISVQLFFSTQETKNSTNGEEKRARERERVCVCTEAMESK